MKDYAGIATQYARDVLEGRIPACKWIRLACARHLNDLQRDEDGFRFTWNPLLKTDAVVDDAGNVIRQAKEYRPADRACMFVELLPHIKGEWAAKAERIRLEAWQVFFLASLFGWVDRDTGKRRFRVADLIVPRKNGKSALAAAIALYMAFVDGEFGAEVYSGATSEDQAHEVFGPAKLMAQRSPDFLDRFGVTVRASSITSLDTNSKLEPVIGKPGDGASPHCAVVDEYHEHSTEELYDTMRTGMGARKQPLMLVTTTAGDDVSGPCYQHQQELQQILEGTVEDDTRFGLIYTIDDDDDWTSIEALIKANPNYGVSKDPEGLQVEQRDAIRNPRKEATFRTKHLNIWVASSSPWLPLEDWREAGDKDLKLEQFEHEEFWLGGDLSSTKDLASVCKVFVRQQPTPVIYRPDGNAATAEEIRAVGDALPEGWVRRIEQLDHYYVFWRHYLPEAMLEDPTAKHYQGWHKTGHLIVTSGSMIDHGRIERDVLDDSERFVLRQAGFDQWNAAQLAANLQNEGIEVVYVPMQVKHLSPAMKWIDGLLASKRLHHDGDPVAAWAISNVEVKPDHNDNWFPRKPLNRARKTDPAIAMIVAVGRAMVAERDSSGIDDFLSDPVTA